MENAYNRMLLVLKQCEGGIESGVRTHENRGITYLSEFGHTFLMHIKETIARAEQAQQAEPVDQQLIDALKLAKNSLVAFKFMPGPHNAWEENDEANLAAVDAAIAAAQKGGA